MNRRWLLCLACAVAPWLAHAQSDPQTDPAALQAQRARIETQRQQEVARYAAQQQACASRFAANDCRNAVKAQERETLAELRRQEVALNAAQRRSAAQGKLELLQRKAAAGPGAGTSPATGAASVPSRRTSAQRTEPAGHGGAQPQARADVESRVAEKEAQRQAREVNAAARRSAHQQQLFEAARHKEELQARRDRKNKPAAQPLPEPP